MKKDWVMFLSLDNCVRLAKAINKPSMFLVTVYSIWGKLSKAPHPLNPPLLLGEGERSEKRAGAPHGYQK
ncbi:MAG: hypothetical protein MUO99_04115 [Dehalococcoidales bacterium]|nr:hypothetical protein [Dehalococcoidales bacterium]